MNKKAKERISKETLIHLYLDQRMTQQEIADRYGYTLSGICRAMKRYGIPTRPYGERSGKKGRRPRLPLSGEDLGRLYTVERRSVPEIARMLSCSTTTVRNRLREYDITREPEPRPALGSPRDVDPAAAGSLGDLYLQLRGPENWEAAGRTFGMEWAPPPREITEQEFLSEGAFVILSVGTGNTEEFALGRWPQVRRAFLEFRSASEILEGREECIQRAWRDSGCPRSKMVHIVDFVASVHQKDWEVIARRLSEGVKYLREFPYMGPTTAYRFAWALGLDCVRPSVTLGRIARITGHKSPEALCEAIRAETGDRLSVIDSVLNHHTEVTGNYQVFLDWATRQGGAR